MGGGGVPVVEDRVDCVGDVQRGGEGVLPVDAGVSPHGGRVAGVVVDEADEGRGGEGGEREGEGGGGRKEGGEVRRS